MLYSDNNALQIDAAGSCIEGKCRQCNPSSNSGLPGCNPGDGFKVH